MEVYIYSLQSDSVVWYVGSTNNLKRREREHRKKSVCGSSDIPKEYEWDMIILERCSDNERKDKEVYYYNSLKPLYNKMIPYTNPFNPLNYWTEPRIRVRCKNVLNDIIFDIEMEYMFD